MIVFALALALLQQDETETGSRLNPRRHNEIAYGSAQAVAAAHRLTECIYSKKPSRVREALAARTSEAAKRAMSRLATDQSCMNLYVANDDAEAQSTAFTFDLLRGMLAEAAIRKDGLGINLAPLPRKADYSAWWLGVGGRAPAINEMSVCVADTDPQGIRTMLATQPESGDEKKAFGGLYASMGPCLVSGGKLSANAQSLRGALAEGLYQRAMASVQVAPAAEVKN